jgi:toxin YoeB
MPYEDDWTPKAAKQYEHWAKHDRRVADKIDDLVAAAKVDPFSGIGHPKKLGHDLSGFYRRTITEEHRLVYKVAGGRILIVRCHGHYK